MIPTRTGVVCKFALRCSRSEEQPSYSLTELPQHREMRTVGKPRGCWLHSMSCCLASCRSTSQVHYLTMDMFNSCHLCQIGR